MKRFSSDHTWKISAAKKERSEIQIGFTPTLLFLILVFEFLRAACSTHTHTHTSVLISDFFPLSSLFNQYSLSFGGFNSQFKCEIISSGWCCVCRCYVIGDSELNVNVSLQYTQSSVVMTPFKVLRNLHYWAADSLQYGVKSKGSHLFKLSLFICQKKKFSHVFIHKNLFVFTLSFFELKLTAGKSQ